jgi:hypothetical protein
MSENQDSGNVSGPLCPVHQRVEDLNQLEVPIGGLGCVACTLNERVELLQILAPCAPSDQSKGSVTVLREVVDFYQTHVVAAAPNHRCNGVNGGERHGTQNRCTVCGNCREGWYDSGGMEVLKPVVAAAPTVEVSDKLMDSQWIAGAKFGWNCGVAGEVERFNNAVDGRVAQSSASAALAAQGAAKVRGMSDREMSGINSVIMRDWNTPEEDKAWEHLAVSSPDDVTNYDAGAVEVASEVETFTATPHVWAGIYYAVVTPHEPLGNIEVTLVRKSYYDTLRAQYDGLVDLIAKSEEGLLQAERDALRAREWVTDGHQCEPPQNH